MLTCATFTMQTEGVRGTLPRPDQHHARPDSRGLAGAGRPGGQGGAPDVWPTLTACPRPPWRPHPHAKRAAPV